MDSSQFDNAINAQNGFLQSFETANGSALSISQHTKSWTNPRKRPYSHDPASPTQFSDGGTALQEPEKSIGVLGHAPKRARAGEWPLKNLDEAVETSIPSQQPRIKSPSPSQRRWSTSNTRPSKFVEGSMNDKTSKKPPILYTGEEEAMERYVKADKEDVEMILDAGIESTKPSGISRFGKAFANAFNPVWQGFNGIWKEKEHPPDPEKKLLEERQVIAEMAYAALKKNGYKGTQNAAVREESLDIPAIKYGDSGDSGHRSFRGSGVDVDGYFSSSHRKTSDQLINCSEGLMPPAPVAKRGRAASPFSDASSGGMSSLHIRKPSFQSLKKATSQINLPSIKKHGGNAGPVPAVEADDTAEQALLGPRLHKQPSKKDIAKQYKLSKKVSDLENKLEAARRELEMSRQEAPPGPEQEAPPGPDAPARIGRKRFVPGALASLPSERLLTPQNKDSNSATSSKGESVTAGTVVFSTHAYTDDNGDDIPWQNPSIGSRSLDPAQRSAPNRRGSGLGARNKGGHGPDTNIDDVLDKETAKTSGRARRPQEFKVSGSPSPSGVKKRQQKARAKTSYNSPLEDEENVPPIHATGNVYDLAKVDKAQMPAMRAIPNRHAAFGTVSDDLVNLRKALPDVSKEKLVDYVNSRLVVKKSTDHTSVSHPDRPVSPFLARPGLASPMKTRGRASRHGTSPPPPSLSSAKKFHRDLDAEKSPPRVNHPFTPADEDQDQLVAKVPQKTYGKASKALSVCKDKPLPDIQKEEFEWDDDVF